MWVSHQSLLVRRINQFNLRQRHTLTPLRVFFVSFAAAILVQCVMAGPLSAPSLSASLAPAAAIAAIATLVEALSPHGTDNFTLQVAVSGAAFAWEGLLPLMSA